MDNKARNFNAKATKNTGCVYWVLGCTKKGMMNYNSKATKDDGSCKPFPVLVIKVRDRKSVV